MNLREGAPCPIAALARKTKCLGHQCPWYIAETKTGCTVLEQSLTLQMLLNLLKEIGQGYERCAQDIESIRKTLEEERKTMTERETTIRVNISGLDNLEKLQAQMGEVAGRTVAAVVNVQVQGEEKLVGLQSAAASVAQKMAGAVSNANSVLAKTSGLFGQIGSVASDVGGKASNAMGMLQKTIQDTGEAASKLIGSLALIGTGAAVSGFSWLGAENAKLYKDQVLETIAANQKLKVSQGDLNAFLEKQSALAYTTQTSLVASLEAASLWGGKKFSKGEGLTDIAAAAEKLAFVRAPSLQGVSGAELLRYAGREGALRPEMLSSLKKATAGVADVAGYDRMLTTAEGRLKLLKMAADELSDTDIKTTLDERPWIRAQINIDRLQKSIGFALAPTLEKLSGMFADLVEKITNIPEASSFIGFMGIAAAGVGTLGLLVNVLSPLGRLILWVAQSSTIASIATKAWAAGQWLLNAAMSANPLGIAIIALAALAGILYLVEQKTHIFSQAWAKISQTPFIQNLIGQLSGLVGWIVRGAAGIAGFIKGFTGGAGFKVVMDIVGAAILGPIGLLLKPLIMAVDFLSKILYKSDKMTKLFEQGIGIWTKMMSFLDWIYSVLNPIYKVLSGLVADIIDKIRSFLPEQFGGYSEEEKAKKAGREPAEKAAAPSPPIIETPGLFGGLLNFLPKNEERKPGDITTNWKGGKEGSSIESVNVTGKPGEPTVPYYFSPQDWMASLTPQEGYVSFGQGPANIDLATKALMQMYAATHGPTPSGERAPGSRIPAGYTPPPGEIVKQKLSPEQEVESEQEVQYQTIMGAHAGTTFAYEKSWKPITSQLGATFPQGGLFFGEVHPTEEIIPQATTQKGPGPISRLLEQIQSGYGSRGIGSMGGGSIGPISVTNNINVNKIDKQSDIDSLISKMSDQAAEQLVFKLRQRLSGNVLREIAFLRG